jgi:retinoid hydroxylase
MTDKLKSADMMPSSFGLPLVGQAIALMANQEKFYWQQQQKYGNIFRISLPIFGFKNIACLIGPEANRLVLKDGADRLSSRLGNKGLEPIISQDTVLLKDGKEHRVSRKMIMPIFHHQAIASYFETMKLMVADAVADWGKKGTINLNHELRKLTLAIVAKVFLGIDKPEEIEQVSQWFTTLMNKQQFPIIQWDIPLTSYGQGQIARRQIVNYIRQAITQRKKCGNLAQFQDALGLLLNTVDEDGNKFTETQVINQAIGFLFAGHETTSSLMTWILFELGNRPEWRQKLRDEQQQVMSNRPIAIQHLRLLPQMSNVIKEGERLYPPAFALIRGVIKDIEYAGYNIPPGWYVFIFPMLTHLLPEIYPKPDTFDPDRFSPPREEDKKQPFSLIGFGGGAHGCIGLEFAQMEMKIILSTLLQKYDWTVTPTVEEISPVRSQFAMQKQLNMVLFETEKGKK